MKALRMALVLVCGAFVSRGVLAQDLATRSNNMNQHMADIEKSVNKIKRAGMIDRDNINLSDKINSHAEETKQAFDLAMAELKKYGETEGRQGDAEAAGAFERLVADHGRRAEKIAANLGEIDGQVRLGRIRLSGDLIQSMSDAEIKEFRQNISKEADDSYKKEHPDKFPGPKPVGTPHALLSVESDQLVATCGPLAGEEKGIFGRLMDGIVPPANAAVAAGCYTACVGGLGFGCLVCVATGSTAAVRAYQSFTSCRNACCDCSFWKPWNYWCGCVCKARCWATFLATLA